jgi:hypothetical protein
MPISNIQMLRQRQVGAIVRSPGRSARIAAIASVRAGR